MCQRSMENRTFLRVKARALRTGGSAGKQLSCFAGLGWQRLWGSSWEAGDWVEKRQETLHRDLANQNC